MAIPHEPHFFKPLLPGFHTGVSIPIVFFSKHIQGQTNHNTWTLRSDASDRTWEVQQEEMELTRGWKEFTEAHDLRVGDIVIFKLAVFNLIVLCLLAAGDIASSSRAI